MTRPGPARSTGSPRPTGAWLRFTGSERRRAWLITALAFLLVCTYLSLWAAFSGSHTYPRYRQLAPGAPGTSGVEHYRVLSLTSSEIAASDGGDPEPAPAGTVWVVATLQVTIDQPEELIGCDLSLLGPGGRVWGTTLDGPSRALHGYCDSEDVRPGVPYTFEGIYEIPTGYADQVRGLVLVNHLSAAPSQVISPA